MANQEIAEKNILLLIADDLGKYLSCYGCRSLQTPNLDQLAATGTRFTHAFASTASCSGSRSTIYTGLHTHENGQYGLNMHHTHFQTFTHVDTAPTLFNDAGWLTGMIGKVHVGAPETYPWTVRDEVEGSRDVAKVADRCENFFEQAKGDGRPFFLTVGFINPHRDIQTRGRFGNKGPYDSRVVVPEVKPEDVEVPAWLPDLPETRQELVEYYKAISRVDQGVGMILAALERQGHADDTLVVFTSENGPPFLNSKTTLYDAGTSLPLLIRRPGGKAGIVNPNMASFLSLLPTLLDYAEMSLDAEISIKSPPRLSPSLLPILSASEILPDAEWRQEIFGSHTFHELQNYWPTRVLRTRKYKYHRNPAWRLEFPFAADLYASLTFEGLRNQDPPLLIGNRPLDKYIFRPSEELYDLAKDPYEVHNLAESENVEYQSILLEMRERLTKWQVQTKDLWLYRDGQSLVMLARYAKDGLQVPERLDFGVGDVGTQGKQNTRWLDEVLQKGGELASEGIATGIKVKKFR